MIVSSLFQEGVTESRWSLPEMIAEQRMWRAVATSHRFPTMFCVTNVRHSCEPCSHHVDPEGQRLHSAALSESGGSTFGNGTSVVKRRHRTPHALLGEPLRPCR